MIYFILFLTILFWGISPIFDKLGVRLVDPFTGIFWRNLTIALAFTIIYLIYSKTYRPINTNFTGIIYFVISGIFAGVLGVLFYFVALKKLDVSIVVPVAATYPLVTAIVAAVFLKEQITFVRIIGIILTIIGICLITVQR
ncbi:MAG: EamA family transporter [Endomicrobia bacterium]|nr:EamA family transporter [Endomicrobiia bacterium]MCX7941453.1 EamA family transporter [Endomicrobiia bacterium]MDW8055443.1 EamA family transporter [Elusimicrobiota bacterium]